MSIQSIYHTGFVVRNLERSLEFYTGLLGMRIERGPAESDSPWLAQVVSYTSVRMKMAYVGVGDGHSIELIEYIHIRIWKQRILPLLSSVHDELLLLLSL